MVARALTLHPLTRAGRGARAAVAMLLVSVVLAGCGDSSGHRDATKREVTVPAYGTFHATTEAVTTGTPALCRRAAEAFTRDAVTFLIRSPTPVDLYFVAARTQFADFQAHSCNPAYLREALSRKLSRKQRRIIVERFPFLGAVGSELD